MPGREAYAQRQGIAVGKGLIVHAARAFPLEMHMVTHVTLSIVAEMIRLSELTGNCGRLISRFLERHLKTTAEGMSFVVKTGALAVENLLEMAVFVASCQDDARLENPFLEYPGLRMEVKPHMNPFEVSLCVHVDRLPDNVKERQKLLKEASHAMDCLVRFHCSVQSRRDMENVMARFLGDLIYKRSSDSFRIFNDLVNGKFDELSACNPRLIALANVLNPEIGKQMPKDFDLEVYWYSPDEVQDFADAELAATSGQAL